MANLASLIGLALVWSVVWANLPSWEELLSEQPVVHSPAVVPELDLTIPGVAAPRSTGEHNRVGGNADRRASRFHHVAESKCAEEVQQICPASLPSEERLRCEALNLKRASTPCRTSEEQAARGK
ncbi:MAG: hypothetical protein NNA21_01470 [Nitrospira sp.]|nr:hypothetical protein [Nitrospira sp.]MCP9462929.1 hypothetical protein [Nitrospira sp.]MCP9474008.1 hypothetical protein [Nitrospira sp.]